MYQILPQQYLTNLIMVIVPEQMWLSSGGSLGLQVVFWKTFFQLPTVEIVHENAEGKADTWRCSLWTIWYMDKLSTSNPNRQS